jgi:hypothetical protein
VVTRCCSRYQPVVTCEQQTTASGTACVPLLLDVLSCDAMPWPHGAAHVARAPSHSGRLWPGCVVAEHCMLQGPYGSLVGNASVFRNIELPG